MKSRRIWTILALAIIAISLLVWWLCQAKAPSQASQPEPPASLPTTGKVEQARVDTSSTAPVATRKPEPPQNAERAQLPKPGTNAKHRVWVKGKYGPTEKDLGKPPSGEQSVPPQGFTITKDGQLLVLDTSKERLVYYDKNGKLQKTVSLVESKFLEPSDVDIARDGTLAILDGTSINPTKGLVMFDAEGHVKAELPDVQRDLFTNGLYAVGNDFYLANRNKGSTKVAESSGKISSETPGIYTQSENGMVPGYIAPDGVTVVDAGIGNAETGDLYVTVTRGNKPDHIFTRFYKVPPDLLDVPFYGADAQGRIYVVVFYTMKLFLACLNEKGDPVGQIEIPLISGGDSGRPNRLYRIMDSGGLVYQVLTDDASSYEVFNCQP